jgi:Spy/CpxP family protein refolding chaperone
MRVKVLAAVAGAALALTGAALMAQEQRQERRPNRVALQAQIGLSDEQVAAIRKIHLQERKAAIRRNADMRIARLELQELMGAATVDEAAIAARVKTLGELQAAGLKARTDSQLAIRKLVTPEQFQKMQQLRHQWMGERGARPARGPMGRGQGRMPSGLGTDDEQEPVDPA